MKFRTGRGSIYGRPEECTPDAVEKRVKRILERQARNKKNGRKLKKKWKASKKQINA